MTSTAEHPTGGPADPGAGATGRSGLRALLRGSAGIAVAMGVMNVATYAFQMISARLLGPADYGALAPLMALLMVVAVLQLGLQATGARRISADPTHVAQIERVVLGVTYRAALGLGALLLVLSPIVMVVLRLDSVLPAILLALSAVPLTVMGGQAGILQGERRWFPLGMVYLGMGVSRVAVGTACLLVSPTETSAMLGVAVAMVVPALIGYVALRRPRDEGRHSEDHTRRPVAREAVTASLALLAFFVLSNADIVVARNVLDDHDAGLYAAGLILTKAVLFLPQFVVVVAFPSMSTVDERRLALLRSLTLVAALGVVATLGAWLLSSLAMVFVGGQEYAEVESRLWLFAVIGTLLAMLQLLVYSVLARQGTRSAYLVWVAVLVLVAAAATTASLGALALVVVGVDAALFVALLALSLHRLRDPAPLS
ncbi:Polysaccharide biosynthesis protein [Nocardioides dokdonensis FR1436]|uniref:Polysaccharide biosynthesis protein n=1 Tax=Nocardioides dokdonensis FR1436 TaxID=1300347 RepID=A0A1A9GR18_9ACTN|nr:polysaccharide biosynthesis protein [Nocardioides dokdonensis]ANH40072.1 Polysaccharide biosynthesis protein [Nocardioides dokdonensis FR1436]